MSYAVEIMFGKEQLSKYRQGLALTDYEKLINRKKYEFETLSERDAFYKGLSEAEGWIEFEVIKEAQTKSNNAEVEPTFDYWDFIEKYYPNYSNCNSILMSDILTRKLSGEELYEKDEEYKDRDIRKELMELDKELLSKAFENFFNTIYPDTK